MLSMHQPNLVACHLSSNSPDGDPWSTFVLASKLRLPDLGRHAIRSMGFSPIRSCSATTIPSSILKDVAGDWALALSKVMKDCWPTVSSRHARVDWTAASKAFTVDNEW